MKKYAFFLALLVVGMISFTACKKDITDELSAISEDLATAQDDVEQVDLDVDQIVDERGGGGTCPTLTWANAQGTFPNVLTIDYGTACTRSDGRVVSGKVIINQSAEMAVAGATRTLTFDNFYVDDVKFEGSRTTVYHGLNASGQPSFTKTATNLKHIYPDGTFSLRNATHTMTMVEGYNTPLVRLDNVFHITGSGTGTGRNGNTFSETIIDPLVKKFTCRWIVAGTAEITRNSRTGTINFGNGDCDRIATVTTQSGDVFTIRLRR